VVRREHPVEKVQVDFDIQSSVGGISIEAAASTSPVRTHRDILTHLTLAVVPPCQSHYLAKRVMRMGVAEVD
jgi:hypothetical protein